MNTFKNKIEVEYIDISKENEVAATQRIFFPFLTVLNDEIRWFSPLELNIVERFICGEQIVEKPHVIEQGKEVFHGELIELNNDTLDLVSDSCTLSNCKLSCQKKREFLTENGEEFYGILHLDKGIVVGGVEYVNSLNVPYHIPKGEDIAFITCVYHSSTKYDYKTLPFLELEKRLAGKFKEIIAITDEEGTFRNGTLEWFLRNGFNDNGVISIEENYCKLHLVSKKIK